MIIYRKNLLTKKLMEKRVVISDFGGGINTEIDERLLPFKCASKVYNFGGKSGVLKENFGIDAFETENIKTATLAEGIIRVWHYKKTTNGIFDDRLIYLTDTFKLFSRALNSNLVVVEIPNIVFKAIPTAVNYRLNEEDVIIFCSPMDEMVVYNGNDINLVMDAPKINSMCLHYERLFATVNGQPNSLWFSDDLNPTNWKISSDEAGFIDMVDERGVLIKVLSFIDYLYVFRTYGIARLSAYAEQSQFSVSQLFVSSGRIYPDTVTICGDRIIFLASDGLYTFDGLSTRKIPIGIDALISSENNFANAAFYNGKYYLSLKLNFDDDTKIMCEKNNYKNNAVIEYDIVDSKIYIARGIDISSLMPIRSEALSALLLCFNNDGINTVGSLNNDSGKVFVKPLPKLWECPLSDLGSAERQKRIKGLYVLSKYDCVFEVECEGKKHSIEISGNEKVSYRRLNIIGDTFKFSFLADTPKVYIFKPIIVYDLM